MKVYKVHKYNLVEFSEGFEFYSSKREAQLAMARYKRLCGYVDKYGRKINNFDDTISHIEAIDVALNKKGILRALNIHGSHNQNG